jgi:hypothetical protein
MDKTLFQNKGTSSVEPKKTETDDTVIVDKEKIDIHSLPQKKLPLNSGEDEKSQSLGEQQLDENWLLLSQDWQAQPFEKTDMKTLVKQTKKRTYWAKSLLALDIVATLVFIIVFIVGFFIEQWSTATQVYLFIGSVGSTIFVYYEFKIRLNTWKRNCGSPEKAVENAIASCESSIKYSKLLKLSSWLMTPIINGYIYIMVIYSDKSFWPPFIIANLFIILMWVIAHVFHKKRLKEIDILSQA